MHPARRTASLFLAAFLVFNVNRVTPLRGQSPASGTALGSGLGGGVFDVTAAVILKRMKEPGASIGVAPKKLDFTGVSVNKSALNVISIMNGTNSKMEIESLLTSSSSFRIASSLNLPFVIPPQTQALLTVEFLPTRSGDYTGTVDVLYQTDGGGKPHKLAVTLRAKGVGK
jgi:hypothetical protein